jgi:magnesium transporter
MELRSHAAPPPAWIAHGILDSIVDSFFPFVEEIGKEVMLIESVVYNEDSPGSIVTVPSISSARARASRLLTSEEKAVPPNSVTDDKHPFFRDVVSIETTKTQFSLSRLTFCLMLRRSFFYFFGFFKPSRIKSCNVKPSVSHASSDLRRIARTRQLVTSLVRVLATKPEVVAGIRKRLMTADHLIAGDDAEVGMYFGDIQGLPNSVNLFVDLLYICIGLRADHILSLQQSLAHYERMLSQSHPIYLQNLRVDFFRARAKADYAGFMFTIVNMLVVLAEAPIGMSNIFFWPTVKLLKDEMTIQRCVLDERHDSAQ